MKRLLAFLTLLLSVTGINVTAQTCGVNPSVVYLLDGTDILELDLSAPLAPGTNPAVIQNNIPLGSNGLAVSPNLNASTPTTTWYTAVGGTVYYFNGTNWVFTGHSAGGGNAAAGGGYVFFMSAGGGNANFFRYDGTGNAVNIATLTNVGTAINDIAVDCFGNIYFVSISTGTIYMLNSEGQIIRTWEFPPAAIPVSGTGMVLVNGTLYFNDNNNLYAFDLVNNQLVGGILLPNIGNTLGSDWANCPEMGFGLVTSHDTVYYCSGDAWPTVSVSSKGPFQWNIVSGTGSIVGLGNTVSINPTSPVVLVEVTSFDTMTCATTPLVDTIMIVRPTAYINAGSDRIIEGCRPYFDTLAASINFLPNWITYTQNWSDPIYIDGNLNTNTPNIILEADTAVQLTYIVTVDPEFGGCVFKDSLVLTPLFIGVDADFEWKPYFGCNSDTIEFTNTSQFHLSNVWDFGDGSPTDTASDPLHVYNTQGAYNVTLIASNTRCADTVTKNIVTARPLTASFTPNRTIACFGTTIEFANTSNAYTNGDTVPLYTWYMGNGLVADVFSPIYEYPEPGVYDVTLVVTDFIGCSDTFTQTITIDSLPNTNIIVLDSVFCAGQEIEFDLDIVQMGLTNTTWFFQDEQAAINRWPVKHGFIEGGKYTVSVFSSYRSCGFAVDTVQITVAPQPQIDLGPDLTICPNSEPLFVADNNNLGNPDATWQWNTGDTSGVLRVTVDGEYYASVTIGGCSSTDTINIAKDCYLDIPNAFSPNGDGYDDYFMPRQFLSKSISTFKMQIFNRYGEKVYETTALDGRGWDGKYNGVDQNIGVYVYLIEVSFANKMSEKYQGNLTLIR